MKKAKLAHVRLSPDVLPIRYILKLKPNLEDFTFQGEETIHVKLKRSVNTITLHAVDLAIEGVVWKDSKKTVKGSVSYDKKSETATFTFPQALSVGEGSVTLSFSGKLLDNMRGFYRSKYFVDGKQHYLATTQFESTDARRAFPSFDEPSMKAIFEVTLQIPKETTAISNTIETGVLENGSGMKTVTFVPTPKMSTYLLAFIVGKFECIEGSAKQNINGENKEVKVRVFTTPGKKNQASFALDVAVKTLEFFEEYFAIPYPLPVMDLIAIPDFASGAMENWGAVTYRETALLVDETHSSTANKQWVALVIGHEIAHQWFGDLVTMEWWTDLWLNEGFASYIEYLAIDHLFPKWDMWTQFLQHDHGAALSLDALKNTHPIEVTVHHPKEIEEIFDAVSYSKGASVIRMLAGYLGEKDFRDGLRLYLKKHSYANASTADLWEAFEKVSGKPVRTIMQNWTRKPGYPFIRVVEKEKDIQLTQQRYFSSSIEAKKAKDNTTWLIPLSVKYGNIKKLAHHLMTDTSLHIPKPKFDEWIKLNSEETSLVRIDYPATYLARLQKPIEEKKLSVIDRFGIIRDSFDLAQTGYLPTHEALALVSHYKEEDNYTVWTEIASQLGKIKNLLADEIYFADFLDFGKELFAPLAKKVGWEKKKGESHTETLLRSLALFSAGMYGDEATLQKAKELFKSSAHIEPDLRGVVYNLVAHTGGAKEYALFEAMYKKETLQEERERISKAMCYFPDKKLLQKALEFSFSGAVRAQDSFIMVTYVWVSPKGKELAWEFVKAHWDDIVKKYGAGGHLLPRFITPASVFATKEKAKEVRDFFKTHKAPGGERAIAQVIEKIYAHYEWFARDENGIREFLHTFSSPGKRSQKLVK